MNTYNGASRFAADRIDDRRRTRDRRIHFAAGMAVALALLALFSILQTNIAFADAARDGVSEKLSSKVVHAAVQVLAKTPGPTAQNIAARRRHRCVRSIMQIVMHLKIAHHRVAHLTAGRHTSPVRGEQIVLLFACKRRVRMTWYQSINQSINQSITIKDSINQSNNQTTSDQSIYRSNDKSINQSLNEWPWRWMNC